MWAHLRLAAVQHSPPNSPEPIIRVFGPFRPVGLGDAPRCCFPRPDIHTCSSILASGSATAVDEDPNEFRGPNFNSRGGNAQTIDRGILSGDDPTRRHEVKIE
jgi:hypothetical protein